MDNLQALGAVVITTLATVVGYLFRQMQTLGKEIAALRDEHTHCKEDVASLRSQLIAEQAMREQVRQYGGGDGADAEVVFDAATGMILEWSPGAMLMLHYSPREMLGKPFLKVLPQRMREKVQAEMGEAARTGRAPAYGPGETHILTREGKEIPVEESRKGWRVGEQYRVGVTFRSRETGDSVNVNQIPPPSGVTT